MDSNTLVLFGQQIPLGLVLVFVQNWLKKQSWFPWLNYTTPRANHLFSVALSGLTTVGIHIAHTGSLSTGGTLAISFPSGMLMLAGIWHWIQQYIVTKTSYALLQDKLNPVRAQQPTAVTTVQDPAKKGA